MMHRTVLTVVAGFAAFTIPCIGFAQSGWHANWTPVPQVQAAVNGLRSTLYNCYTSHVPASSRAHGDVATVRVVVAQSGEVFRVDFLEGSTRSPEFERCVRDAFARLTFTPKPQDKMTFVQQIGFQNGLDKLQFEVPRAAGGAITKESVEALAKMNSDAIQACYTAALASAPGLRGQVLIEIVVDGRTGAVTSARVAKSTLGNAQVESCVLEKVRAFAFGIPDDPGLVILQFPLTFDAG